jgi:hypothetical protein
MSVSPDAGATLSLQFEAVVNEPATDEIQNLVAIAV